MTESEQHRVPPGHRAGPARRVVVTGIGAVTPVGNDATTTWSWLTAGRSGVRRLTAADAAAVPVRIGGRVEGFRLADHVAGAARWRHLPRAGEFGVAAAVEALQRARIAPGTYDHGACGVAVAGAGPDRPPAGPGVIHLAGAPADRYVRRPPGDLLVRDRTEPHTAIAELASCTGPVLGPGQGCAGSGGAIGEAFRCIQEGAATLMLAGGFDALAGSPDAGRTGEGAVVVVLEELTAARARGAPVLAELLGYASARTADRIADRPPGDSGPVRAMAGALTEARLAPDRVDCVVADGTLTRGGDRAETAAIKTLFGLHAYRLVVTSPASMVGRLASAGGALNLLCAVGAVQHSIVPPTVDLDTRDPRLDLDYVPRTARRTPVAVALVDSSSGGANTCLAVGRLRDAG